MAAGKPAPVLVAGARQVRRALDAGQVIRLFAAQDADPAVTDPPVRRCGQEGIAVEWLPSMKQLGAKCGLSVAAAVAAQLRPAEE